MGEYANYMGERVKIGTCEDMLYLRWDQRHLVTESETPLFDEKTGRSTPREQYVFTRHPDIASACGADAGP